MTEWENYCLRKEADIQKMFPNANLKNPQTFTDKLHWLKIHDSTLLKSFCSDKITLHDYCIEKLGKDICIPILKTYNSVNEINLNELPNSFVMKCNHGSAMNIIVEDKTKFNFQFAKQKLDKWLKEDYSVHSELHYKLIPHKILVEEYKANLGRSDLTDYKFFCFNGEPKFCQVITDRRAGEKISHYDLNWKYSPRYDWKQYSSDPTLEKPKHYEKMIEYAKLLAKDFKLVRVDFYEIDDSVYLGELTFVPANGKQIFKNPNTNLELGKLLRL